MDKVSEDSKAGRGDGIKEIGRWMDGKSILVRKGEMSGIRKLERFGGQKDRWRSARKGKEMGRIIDVEMEREREREI